MCVRESGLEKKLGLGEIGCKDLSAESWVVCYADGDDDVEETDSALRVAFSSSASASCLVILAGDRSNDPQTVRAAEPPNREWRRQTTPSQRKM